MNTSHDTTCPCCEGGALQSIKRDYTADLGEGLQLRVPDIQMEVCDKCGEEILTLEAAREVDEAIAEHTDRLQ